MEKSRFSHRGGALEGLCANPKLTDQSPGMIATLAREHADAMFDFVEDEDEPSPERQ